MNGLERRCAGGMLVIVSRFLGLVRVSQLFPHISSHIVHILIHAVYLGSTRSYLPGYTTLQSLRLMHGVLGWMLETGFDPGLWGVGVGEFAFTS